MRERNHVPDRRLTARVVLVATVPCLLLFSLHAPVVFAATPSFGEPRPFGTGADITNSVTVGDMDGDGHLDLVVGNAGANAVYLNDGLGSFSRTGPAVRPFGTGADGTIAVAVGDLDNDGALDIVAGNNFQQNVVYLNDRDGAFPSAFARTFGTGSDATTSLVVGDMDGDGDFDVVVGNAGSFGGEQNAVCFNDGDGNLTCSESFGTAGSSLTQSVAVGDMDGDGYLDIVAVNAGQQNKVYLNDGSGGFSSSVGFGPGSDNTWGVAVGDVDGDGYLDIVVGNSPQQNVVYLNDGSASSFSPVNFGTGSDSTQDVAVGDIDGDGDLDIVAGNQNEQNVVYLNDGAGNFGSGINFGTGADTTYSVAAADLDDDGHLDLVAGNYHYDGAQNVAYLNGADGGFSNTMDFGGSGEDTENVVVGGMNGDGHLDVVVGNRNALDAIYVNDGSGSLTLGTTFGTAFGPSESMALGDLNGDGHLDVIVGEYGEPNTVYMNAGDGTFFTTLTFGIVLTQTSGIAVGDVDGDGDLDIVAGNHNEPNAVYINEGGGVFTSRSFGTGEDRTESVALGDMDGDGDLDIVVGNTYDGANYDDERNAIYWNDGGGTFETAHYFGSTWENTLCVAVNDLDGDGSLDVVVGNIGQQNFVRLNDGSGNLNWAGATRAFGTGSDNTWGVAVGDVDGDGDLDIAIGDSTEQNSIFWNDGAGGFDWSTPSHSLGTASDSTASVALGDVDGDGDLDIVLGNGITSGEQNTIVVNNSRTPNRLANNPPRVTVVRPGGTANADFYSSPEILSSQLIPIPYTLYDPEGEPVDHVEASYSPDGGGKWYEAMATNTITTNLGTVGLETFFLRNANSGPITDFTTITSTIGVAAADVIVDVDAYIDVLHTWDGDLVITLTAPFDRSILLVNRRGSNGQNFTNTIFDDEASVSITAGTAPFTGRYRPEQPLYWLDGHSPQGVWTLAIADMALGDGGTLLSWGITVTMNSGAVHIFTWDTFASGFFGQSDDVVFRIEAYPNQEPYTNTVAGVNQWPYAAAQTFPFRVRGTQVRVFSEVATEGNEAAGAMVYRIQAGQSRGGTPFVDGLGQPLRTDSRGYLRGRGVLQEGDRLVALLPVGEGETSFVAFEEDFEGSFPPPGWALDETGASDDPGWQQGEGNSHGGSYYAWHDDDDTTGDAVSWLVSPPITVPVGARLVFWQRDVYEGYYNYHGVWITTTSATEPPVSSFAEVWTGDTGAEWSEQVIDLSEYAGQRVYIAFRYMGDYADEWYIDDVALIGMEESAYTRFHTNATPTLTGLEAHTVSAAGVQTLTVSADNPLMLFDLSVSLQWDARNDEQFMSTLTFDLERASEFLYDWTDGQVALGEVTVHHDRDYWNEAHVRVYASNELRPSAAQGGVVGEVVTDTGVLTITYAPGQVLMGAEWNRYGEAGSSIDEDWPRTLAHELGHYLLFLADNYLGLDANDQLVTVEGCPGAMTDPYRKDEPYDEFHLDNAGWDTDCSGTLSEQTTGRADWATINAFYPWLASTVLFAGPNGLPLEVTRVREAELEEEATALDDPTFYLLQTGSRVQPGSSTRAFLFQEDWAVDLGSPTQDTVLARGASAGDTVCVYELSATTRRMGCEVVSEIDEELELVPRTDWAPDIVITPVNSRTINITLINNADVLVPLSAGLYPLTEPASGTISLSGGPRVFTGVFDLAYPALEGYVRVWVNEGPPRREAIADYAIGGNPASMRGWNASMRGWNASMRGWNASMRGWNAPMSSVDGQMILYVDETELGDDDFYAVQSTTYIPSPPPWTSVVGKAYRIMASSGVTNLVEASMYWTYMSDDVPTGEEAWVRLYHWNTTLSQWDPLPTTVDTYHNSASAPCNGPGLYALMSSYEVPLYGPGWNLVSYPLQVTRTVTQALLSINDHYTTVYGYEPTQVMTNPWLMFDKTVPPVFNTLTEMEFGRGYWISATGVVTWQVSDPSAASVQVEGAGTAESPPYPPATYWGVVNGGDGFAPVPGMEVIAWVGDSPCGRGEVVDIDGQPMYIVHVSAAGVGAYAGCGTVDKTVTFQVGGEMMTQQVLWDTRRVWKIDLTPEGGRHRIYLPLILR